MLIRDRTVIIYDNAVRSTKIARGLNFMKRLAELPMLNVEPIADILRRISPLVPNDASHAGAYSSYADPSLNDRAFRDQQPPVYPKTVNSTPCLRPGKSGGRERELLQFKLRHCPRGLSVDISVTLSHPHDPKNGITFPRVGDRAFQACSLHGDRANCETFREMLGERSAGRPSSGASQQLSERVFHPRGFRSSRWSNSIRPPAAD
jgi:hypothetical protein